MKNEKTKALFKWTRGFSKFVLDFILLHISVWHMVQCLKLKFFAYHFPMDKERLIISATFCLFL